MCLMLGTCKTSIVIRRAEGKGSVVLKLWGGLWSVFCWCVVSSATPATFWTSAGRRDRVRKGGGKKEEVCADVHPKSTCKLHCADWLFSLFSWNNNRKSFGFRNHVNLKTLQPFTHTHTNCWGLLTSALCMLCISQRSKTSGTCWQWSRTKKSNNLPSFLE